MLASKLRVCVEGTSKLWSVRIRPGKAAQPRQISRGKNQWRPSVASMMRWPQALVVATLARNCLKPPPQIQKKIVWLKGQSDVLREKENQEEKWVFQHPTLTITQDAQAVTATVSWLFTPFKTLRLMQHPRKTWRPGLSLQNGSFFLCFRMFQALNSKLQIWNRIQIQTRAQLLSQGVQPWMAFQ